jgi:hypothetical protein
MTIIPFGDWAPDLAALGNPGALVAKNCLPQGSGYGRFPSLEAYAGPSALPATVIGGFVAADKDGNSYNYAATSGGSNAGKLYVLSATAWVDRSGNGKDGTSGYSVSDRETWEFAKWGERVLAVCIDEPMQQIAFGGTAFANAITSTRTPRARHIAVVRDFVVLGNIDDVGNDGLVPNRVWWSGIDDYATFEEGGASSQSDFQDLANGGKVQKIVSGEVGIVFCESSIYRMTYVGPPLFFSFDEVETNRGVAIPGSVARAGGTTFFVDHDGLYAWTGEQSVSLGTNRFDRALMADIDLHYAHRVSSTIWHSRKLYLMAYPSIAAPGGMPDRIFVYDWANRKASIAELSVDWLTSMQPASADLDSPDPSEPLDIEGASLDDVSHISNVPSVAAFNQSHVLCTFTGPALTATIDTGEQQLVPGYGRAVLVGARPLVDGAAAVTVQPFMRNTQSELPAAGDIIAMNALGNCPLRANSRFVRFRATIAGDFAAALGIEPDFRPAGGR